MKRLDSSKMRRLGVMLMTLMLCCLMSACATRSDTAAEGAFVDTMIAPVPFAEAWKLTRDVLLEKDVEIHIRDKRGLFVVYTGMYRRKLVVPHRTKVTITLTIESDTSTRIAVETVHQKYSVTLLTHPEWLDQRDVSSDSTGVEILESVKSIISRNLKA
jgi:hypothetical protein